MSLVSLTVQELALLRALASGKPRKEIASDTGRSRDAVDREVRALLNLLGARNDAHAVHLGHLMHLIAAPTSAREAPRYADPPAVIRQRRHDLNEAMAGYRPRRGPGCLAGGESGGQVADAV